MPGAADAIGALRANGARIVFFTNNSSHRISDLVSKLGAMGVAVLGNDVLSSAQCATALLVSGTASGSRVLACAGPGVIEAVEAGGFEVVDQLPAAAVVVGWHRTFDFAELAMAQEALVGGARFIATNLDPSLPVSGGVLPGNGAIVAAIATASSRTPEVAGKPQEPAAALLRAKLGLTGIVIGDRPSTDGEFARRLGWPFGLVSGGVLAEGEESMNDSPARWIAPDLGELAKLILDSASGD